MWLKNSIIYFYPSCGSGARTTLAPPLRMRPPQPIEALDLRDTSGGAPPQLLNVSLSFEYVTGVHKLK